MLADRRHVPIPPTHGTQAYMLRKTAGIPPNVESIRRKPYEKVFAAMQRRDERCHALRPLTNGEVAQVPDLIVGFNHRIPPIDHLAIHLGNGCKRTAVKAQCPRMAKVMVTREVGRHCLRPWLSNQFVAAT